jgi:RHS repeat-associated protein
MFDENGNVTTLSSVMDGTVFGQYEYGPFGEVIRETGPIAKPNPLRFASEYEDQETGLIYYDHRFYNPNLGKWLSRDPLGENNGDPNLYGFVFNAPLDNIDVFGLCGACCCCVEDLQIGNVQSVVDIDRFGYSFDLTISLSFKAGASQSGCGLKWIEKSNIPYYPSDDPKFPAKSGTDMFTKDPGSDTFQNWGPNSSSVHCPSTPDPFKLTDTPTIAIHDGKTRTRTLTFAITVTSSPNCTCANKSKTVKATEVLVDKKGGADLKNSSFNPD